MRLPDSLAPLRSPPFRWFFAGQAASLIGDGMVSVALAFAVLDVTGSVRDLGLVLGARTICTIAGLLLGGTIADRFAHRPVMVVSDLVRFGTQAVFAALLFTDSAQLWQMVVLAGISGAASAFFLPAVSGLTPRLVPASVLQQANALRWAAVAAGNIGGPAVAGVIVAASSPAWAIAVDSGTYLISAATLLAMRLPAMAAAAATPLLRELIQGWREFSSRPWIWAACISATATNALLVSPFYVVGPLIARDHLGGASTWALIVSAGGIGSLLGTIVALRVRPARPMLVATLLFAGFAVPLALLALIAPAWTIALASLAAGAGGLAGNIFWETTVQERVPAEALSRVSAYDWLASLAAAPVGYAASGILVERVGATEALWIMFAIGAAICCVIPFVPAVRRLRAQPHPAG